MKYADNYGPNPEYEVMLAEQRAAQNDALQNALTRATRPQPMTTSSQDLGFVGLIRAARQAHGDYANFPGGTDEPRGVIRQQPAVTGSFNLADTAPAPSSDLARTIDTRAMERTSGAVHTMGRAVLSELRVLQTGVRMIFPPAASQIGDISRDPNGNAVGVNPLAARLQPARLEIIGAVPFNVVADGADVTTSALNIAAAEIHLADEASHALSFTLKRREQKDRSDEDLAFILARTMALSIGQLIDRVTLGAIMAQTLTPFTVGKAAARSLRVSDLAALVGTAGTGATFDAMGVLRCAGGIEAETTESMTQSLVFAPSRIGVVIEPEIRVNMRRTSVQGDLEVTVFASAQTLLPTGANDIWLAA